MDATEQSAHDEILRRCRATPPGGWVMRGAPQDPLPGYEWTSKCQVHDLSRATTRRFRSVAHVVAGGETWVDVLNQLDK